MIGIGAGSCGGSFDESFRIHWGAFRLRLLALCARLERGNEFPRALQVCVLNKVPDEDRKVIAETFDHHVGPLGQVKASA